MTLREFLATLCATSVVAVSAVSIIGYIAHVELFSIWTGVGPGMALETSICLLLLGAGQLLFNTSTVKHWLRCKKDGRL